MRHRKLILAALAALISVPGSAREATTSLETAHAPSLVSLGDDVIRVTRGNSRTNPRISTVELHSKDQNWAVGSVTFYGVPHEGDWVKTGEVEIDLTSPEYRRLAEQADELIASYKEGPLVNDVGEMLICTDGPMIVVERRNAEGERQLKGGCGDPALVDIATLMFTTAAKRLALYGLRFAPEE